MIQNHSAKNTRSLTHAFQRTLRYAGLSISLCIASLAFGTNKTSQPPSLDIQGQRHPNACLESQTVGLKKMILARRALDTTQAWHAIDILLCAPKSHANRAAVRKLIKGRVKRIIESTGDAPEQKWVRASEELAGQVMADGQAWKAEIEVEAQTITLRYYPNEACIRMLKLEYTKSKWILSELAEACD